MEWIVTWAREIVVDEAARTIASVLDEVPEPMCFPHNFVLNLAKRTIRCNKCERLFDPYQAVHLIIADWPRCAANLKAMRTELEGLGKQRDELKRQVQNLKAQAKRAGEKK